MAPLDSPPDTGIEPTNEAATLQIPRANNSCVASILRPFAETYDPFFRVKQSSKYYQSSLLLRKLKKNVRMGQPHGENKNILKKIK